MDKVECCLFLLNQMWGGHNVHCKTLYFGLCIYANLKSQSVLFLEQAILGPIVTCDGLHCIPHSYMLVWQTF